MNLLLSKKRFQCAGLLVTSARLLLAWWLSTSSSSLASLRELRCAMVYKSCSSLTFSRKTVDIMIQFSYSHIIIAFQQKLSPANIRNCSFVLLWYVKLVNMTHSFAPGIFNSNNSFCDYLSDMCWTVMDSATHLSALWELSIKQTTKARIP